MARQWPGYCQSQWQDQQSAESTDRKRETNNLPFTRREPHALKLRDKSVTLEYLARVFRFQIVQKFLGRVLIFCILDQCNRITNGRTFLNRNAESDFYFFRNVCVRLVNKTGIDIA